MTVTENLVLLRMSIFDIFCMSVLLSAFVHISVSTWKILRARLHGGYNYFSKILLSVITTLFFYGIQVILIAKCSPFNKLSSGI